MAWTDRAFANVNFGLQEQSRTRNGSTLSLYGEDGSLTTSQPIDGGALFDLGGWVWKNLAVGLGYSRGVRW